MTARSVAIVIGLTVVASACGDAGDDPGVAGPTETSPGGVAIAAVVDDVEYYIGCANESVAIDGTTWYPVAEWGNGRLAELHGEITSVERQPTTGPVGFVGVAPPGPGDDVGTLYVYDDGFAWYESHSGQSIWLTQDALAYDWVC